LSGVKLGKELWYAEKEVHGRADRSAAAFDRSVDVAKAAPGVCRESSISQQSSSASA